MLGLMLGAVGTLGATIHGGYDLANGLNPPRVICIPRLCDVLATAGAYDHNQDRVMQNENGREA